MPERLTLESFAERLNTKFRASGGESALVELELIQADDLGSNEKQETFSVVFRGPRGGLFLPQGIYKIEHEALLSFDLFLVPIGPDDQGMRYEAVFNRMKH